MNTERFRISDEIWSKIQWVVPGKESDPGRTGANNRLFVEAVVFIARTGAPWRDLPRGFGPYGKVVIPSQRSRAVQRQIDQEQYRERNLIERFFCKAKEVRRLATRYEKLLERFASFILIVAGMLWA